MSSRPSTGFPVPARLVWNRPGRYRLAPRLFCGSTVIPRPVCPLLFVLSLAPIGAYPRSPPPHMAFRALSPVVGVPSPSPRVWFPVPAPHDRKEVPLGSCLPPAPSAPVPWSPVQHFFVFSLPFLRQHTRGCRRPFLPPPVRRLKSPVGYL